MPGKDYDERLRLVEVSDAVQEKEIEDLVIAIGKLATSTEKMLERIERLEKTIFVSSVLIFASTVTGQAIITQIKAFL